MAACGTALACLVGLLYEPTNWVGDGFVDIIVVFAFAFDLFGAIGCGMMALIVYIDMDDGRGCGDDTVVMVEFFCWYTLGLAALSGIGLLLI